MYVRIAGWLGGNVEPWNRRTLGLYVYRSFSLSFLLVIGARYQHRHRHRHPSVLVLVLVLVCVSVGISQCLCARWIDNQAMHVYVYILRRSTDNVWILGARYVYVGFGGGAWKDVGFCDIFMYDIRVFMPSHHCHRIGSDRIATLHSFILHRSRWTI